MSSPRNCAMMLGIAVETTVCSSAATAIASIRAAVTIVRPDRAPSIPPSEPDPDPTIDLIPTRFRLPRTRPQGRHGAFYPARQGWKRERRSDPRATADPSQLIWIGGQLGLRVAVDAFEFGQWNDRI